MDKYDNSPKKMTFSFNCEVEIADKFRDAVKADGRTITFVMQRLMKRYIKEVQEELEKEN